MDATREELIFKAKLADNADRYDEMADVMIQVGTMGLQLTPDERNLFSLACKNSVSSRRASIRILSSIENKENQKDPDENRDKKLAIIRKYQSKVEGELQTVCKRIISTIRDKLIPATGEDREASVFFHKIEGDYYRYLAEIIDSKDENEGPVAGALEAYKKAQELSKDLEPTNPVVLGLVLNYSVFCYEILQSPQKACVCTKNAFDAALKVLPNCGKEDYHNAAVIMKLMKDNLILWTADYNGSDSDEEAPSSDKSEDQSE
mmetsp:Transcript_40478/g.64030  ORF Transcript_40478/g.64030 Transcript_40478/m.64030 type:complete len:262 (-) Transcript_40478:209-994(-)|eukprot:CAMPEP_0201519116 /NCGR_PEP_ID=MMETSP0161_2-20130828/9752_1 /ASSEMBLY_ACC=CAM_ASM_000251 /TAXON_ID=180227 /ORGANISM="Neoparamoeba aestuarina, Strain SoJaBio B1-5/56/2" /LENGTH=261 /DNA_ID=CAMNT_0047917061 /DNA_START=91 /DNA_END=876 /DNA_ORIENTATION=-